MNKKTFKNNFGNEILFSNQEYLDRVKKVKLKMSKNKIDVLLVASPANQFYLTGYDGWSFYTPQMVLISLSEKLPYWIGRKMDAVGAKFTSFLDKKNIVPYPDQYVAAEKIHPMDFLVNFIKSKKLDKKRIGVEMDDYYYTAKWHDVLVKGLPNAKFINAFLLVNWVRMVKSSQELTYMKSAGKIANLAMKKAMEAVDIGVRQCDVIAELNKYTTKGTNNIGSIRILEYSLEGILDRLIVDDGSTVKVNTGETQLIKPPYIYKVFRIDDVEIISATGLLAGTEL